jgi:ferredoxin
VKITVDRDLCASHGQCEFAAPQVFSINDEGDLEVLDASPPESERPAVEQAVRRCPSNALSLAD